MVACPFDIPKYEWESTSPWVQKCTFCSERISEEGGAPACVKTCPTEALLFGDEAKIVAEAKKRIGSGRYLQQIYGENEVGGTAWIYITDKKTPFEDLGFNTNVGNTPLPSLSWAHLSKIPLEIVGFVAVLAGVAFVKGRNTEGGQ